MALSKVTPCDARFPLCRRPNTLTKARPSWTQASTPRPSESIAPPVTRAPESLDILYYLGLAYLKTNDSAAAFESFTRFLDAEAPIEWDATHLHTFGSCQGTLTLTNTSIAYRSPGETDRDHWFDVSLTGLEQAGLRFDSRLLLRASSAKGKAKNWTFHFSLLDEHEQITDIILRYIEMRRQ